MVAAGVGSELPTAERMIDRQAAERDPGCAHLFAAAAILSHDAAFRRAFQAVEVVVDSPVPAELIECRVGLLGEVGVM